MRIGPTVLRGRRPRTTYLYEDPDDQSRATSALGDPWFTSDDRALLMGLEAYESTLCPGVCGQPRDAAWHHDVKEKWKGEKFLCHACSALRGEQVVFVQMTGSPTFAELEDLEPFSLERTTTAPAEPPPR